ncbi:uncharacterized protein HGUI_02363 [Hanseniaspora guilliermondii]|uniref:Uncharacterized protein n=1 Tax=Hanseniaspora guilliermondii TaxID=56406 RepID=A0A1L0B545_9ASCO|nr:uncharacterized protein HGUI_02363 [Hanseniaspora guilliermondii]
MIHEENFQELQKILQNILPYLQDAIPRIIDIIKQIIDFINSPEGQALIQIIKTIIKVIIGLLGASAILPQESLLTNFFMKFVQGYAFVNNLIRYSEMNIEYLTNTNSLSQDASKSLDLKELAEMILLSLFVVISKVLFNGNSYLNMFSLFISMILLALKLREALVRKALMYMPPEHNSIITNEERFNAFIAKHADTELDEIFNGLIVSVNQSILTYIVIEKASSLY